MVEVTESQKSEILMLSGMNWTNEEIAAEVGIHRSTVSAYLNEFEERSKAADDWKPFAKGVLVKGMADDLIEKMYGV